MENRYQEIVSYYKKQPYQTQAQRIYDMLLELIALDVLPDKSVYTELELTQMLQIGRTPLRDALKLLEFDSIVEAIPRRGIQIRELRIDDYFLQAEVRTTLEFVVTQRACSLLTSSMRERLAQLNSDFETVADEDDRLTLYRIDRNIHALIDEGSQNPYAVHALSPLRFFEQRIHYQLNTLYPDIGISLNQEHVQYVNAIVEGDEDSAHKHFKSMIEYTLKLVRLSLNARIGQSVFSGASHM